MHLASTSELDSCVFSCFGKAVYGHKSYTSLCVELKYDPRQQTNRFMSLSYPLRFLRCFTRQRLRKAELTRPSESRVNSIVSS